MLSARANWLALRWLAKYYSPPLRWIIVKYFPIFKTVLVTKNVWKIINTISSIRFWRYARLFFLVLNLFLKSRSFTLSERYLLLGTDNLRGQISEYTFTPNEGFCLYIPQLVKSLSFYIPEAWKTVPPSGRASPCRQLQGFPPSKKWLDTTIQVRFPFFPRICSRNEEKTNCIVHCASHYHILILSFSLTVLDDLQYSPEEKKNILNEYYHRLEEELLSSPEYYMLLTLWNAFIIIEKS